MRFGQLVSLLVLAAVGCGDNLSRTQPGRDAATTSDSQTGSDAGTDASDDAAVDAAVDAAPDAPPDAFTGADAIAAARATADGTGLSLTIPNVIVTYIKPAIGDPTSDPAGLRTS